MAFFRRPDIQTENSSYGRVYVLRFELDNGDIVHKVGMCKSSRSIDRMMEILRDFFKVYRYVPRCTMRKDKKVVTPHLVEKYLHEAMNELSYSFDKKFGGSTEFFIGVDEGLLLDWLDDLDYGIILADYRQMKKTDYDDISMEMKRIRADKEKKANKDATDELLF